MSVAVETLVDAGQMEGRQCYVPELGRVGVLRSASAGEAPMVVFDGGRPEVDAAGAVTLPKVGELMRLPRRGGVVAGYWVGLAGGPDAGARVTVRILTGAEVVEHVCDVSALAAGEVVAGAAGPETADALRAVARVCGLLDAQRAEHADWKGRLSAAACERADEQDWCSQFDDFMDQWGLQGRLWQAVSDSEPGYQTVDVWEA